MEINEGRKTAIVTSASRGSAAPPPWGSPPTAVTSSSTIVRTTRPRRGPWTSWGRRRRRAMKFDVASAAEAEKAMEDIAARFRLDALVNNAGMSGGQPLSHDAGVEWDAVIATTLRAFTA